MIRKIDGYVSVRYYVTTVSIYHIDRPCLNGVIPVMLLINLYCARKLIDNFT